MNLRRHLLVAILILGACKPAFNAGRFGSTDDLYRAALVEYNARRWENAVTAFERLTTELPPRDPRLPAALFYLGTSQQKRGDHLLAAKTYSRVFEIAPTDTLADDALLASGLAYQRLWRKPVLDAEYGDFALTQYQQLRGSFPNSVLLPQATEQIAKVDEWYAAKDYETGYHYLRRKAYDSAIIYFKDVIRLRPSAPSAKNAYLRLHEAYSAINYKDDARDLCDAMRKAYPADREVRAACGAVPAVVTAPPQ
ncbi:MAG: outer membrane protein assembly factor BamD [Gemmatimonadaceae bacterium]